MRRGSNATVPCPYSACDNWPGDGASALADGWFDLGSACAPERLGSAPVHRWLFVLAIVWGWACLGPRSASVPAREVPSAPDGGPAQVGVPAAEAGQGGMIADAGVEARPSDAGAGAAPSKGAGIAPPADPGALRPAEPPPPETNKRLDFRSGDPVVPIRLMEGGTEATFSGRGRIRMRVGGPVEKTIEAPARTWFTVRITHGRPAKLAAFVQLAEVPFADRGALAAEQQTWEARGLKVRAQVLGTVYGIAGKVIDNRRYLLLVDAPLTSDEAKAEQARILREFATRTQLFEQTLEPSGGVLEVLDADGSVVAVGEGAVTVEVIEGQFFDVKRVEFGVGYDFHNFEDRTYRGGLQLTPDRNGALAVVNLVALEDLLKGLVPSEIFARAHPEALKAQAVTARGEVLAKIGTKHLADPYLLCSEQHCAVYRGLTGEALSTNAAVEHTRGEALFAADGRLVDSVYSAVCGGHSEDNDAVWGGLPNPSLRGRPDVIGPAKGLPNPCQARRLPLGTRAARCLPALDAHEPGQVPLGEAHLGGGAGDDGRAAEDRPGARDLGDRARGLRAGEAAHHLGRGGGDPDPRRAQHPPALRHAEQRDVPGHLRARPRRAARGLGLQGRRLGPRGRHVPDGRDRPRRGRSGLPGDPASLLQRRRGRPALLRAGLLDALRGSKACRRAR